MTDQLMNEELKSPCIDEEIDNLKSSNNDIKKRQAAVDAKEEQLRCRFEKMKDDLDDIKKSKKNSDTDKDKKPGFNWLLAVLIVIGIAVVAYFIITDYNKNTPAKKDSVSQAKPKSATFTTAPDTNLSLQEQMNGTNKRIDVLDMATGMLARDVGTVKKDIASVKNDAKALVAQAQKPATKVVYLKPTYGKKNTFVKPAKKNKPSSKGNVQKQPVVNNTNNILGAADEQWDIARRQIEYFEGGGN